ncbi:putative lrr receptor-like serinethreonine-protein kinase, partial [Nicotiana attenuata]
LQGLIPATIGSLSSLQVISLSRNQLSGVVPASFFCNGSSVNAPHAIRIIEFRLANSTLTGEVPESIMNLASLGILDLGGNRFSGLIPQFLGNLTSLRMLSLSGSNFQQVWGVFISQFGNRERTKVGK